MDDNRDPKRSTKLVRRERAKIQQCMLSILAPLSIEGKTGKKLLQPMIAEGLERAGYVVDVEDTLGYLPPSLPVWRRKDTGEIEPTAGRRRIDIVVYKNASPIALVETESDLNALRESGYSKGSGQYDVFSISRSGSGEWFNSYKSLERMASAVHYNSRTLDTESKIKSRPNGVHSLECIQSDAPTIHNPHSLPLFLVTGTCRERDPRILLPRLRSLDATLVCASDCSVTN